MTSFKYWVLALVGVTLTGCDSPLNDINSSDLTQSFSLLNRSFSGEKFHQWKLPKELKEISGLALTEDQRLFAHSDEIAVLFELNYADGSIVKSFAIGNPVAKDDFEGVAYIEGQFYLVSSKGRIYIAEEGVDGGHVDYQIIETKLGEGCEIEGAAYDPETRQLLVVCKRTFDPNYSGIILVKSWSIDSQQQSNLSINIELEEVVALTGNKQFNPSGIEWVQPDRLLIVASRQRAILETNLNGEVINAFKLPLAGYHIQTEGITIDKKSQLILADEGKNGRGRLGVYRPAG